MKKIAAIVKYLFFPFLFAQSAEAVNWSNFMGPETVTATVTTENTVWVGTHHGLWIINTKTHKATHLTAQNSVLPSDEVTALAITSNGDVYAATPKGIFRNDGYSNLVINSENSNLPSSDITTVIADENDNLWIGTKGQGLILMNNCKCRFFNTKNSVLTSNNVTKVKSDDKGNILVQLSNEEVVKVTDQGMSVMIASKITDTQTTASGN